MKNGELQISDARKLGKALRAKGVLILAISEDGSFTAASWGKDARECNAMRGLSEQVCDQLEEGVLRIGSGGPGGPATRADLVNGGARDALVNRSDLITALRSLHDACDRLMGDTDDPDPNSFEMRAMRRAAALLEAGAI